MYCRQLEKAHGKILFCHWPRKVHNKILFSTSQKDAHDKIHTFLHIMVASIVQLFITT
jgi:hypothetical protein